MPPLGHTPPRYSYSPFGHLACASDLVEHSGSYLLAMLHGLCRVHFLLDLDGMKLAFLKADFFVDPDAEGADASATRGGATPLPAPGLTVPAGGQAATDGAPATNPRNPGAAAAAATAARSPTTAQISSMTDVEFGKFYHVICGYVIEPAAGMPAPPPSTTPDQWVKKMMLPEHLQRAQEVAAAFTAQPDLFITDRKKLFGQSALDAVAQSSATQTSVHPARKKQKKKHKKRGLQYVGSKSKMKPILDGLKEIDRRISNLAQLQRAVELFMNEMTAAGFPKAMEAMTKGRYGGFEWHRAFTFVFSDNMGSEAWNNNMKARNFDIILDHFSRTSQSPRAAPPHPMITVCCTPQSGAD